MNFWTPAFNHAWASDFFPEDMPWYLSFDYVELYHWDEHTDSFEKAWRDDFVYFDQTRWHKLSGSTRGNSSVFYPQNVFTHAGNLFIKLEPERHDLRDHERHRESHYLQ